MKKDHQLNTTICNNFKEYLVTSDSFGKIVLLLLRIDFVFKIKRGKKKENHLEIMTF